MWKTKPQPFSPANAPICQKARGFSSKKNRFYAVFVMIGKKEAAFSSFG